MFFIKRSTLISKKLVCQLLQAWLNLRLKNSIYSHLMPLSNAVSFFSFVLSHVIQWVWNWKEKWKFHLKLIVFYYYYNLVIKEISKRNAQNFADIKPYVDIAIKYSFLGKFRVHYASTMCVFNRIYTQNFFCGLYAKSKV